jgi:hypothetical protein
MKDLEFKKMARKKQMEKMRKRIDSQQPWLEPLQVNQLLINQSFLEVPQPQT